MNITHIEHIGIAVSNLEEAIQFYENALGLKCYAIEEVRDQKVRTAFFKVGEIKIELLEAIDTESPVAKFIEKKGPGFHHIAFAVGDVADALNSAADHGIRLVDTKPRIGAEGMKIGFLHPGSTFGVLTELCGE